MPGWATTTMSGRISRSVWCRRSSDSGSPPHAGSCRARRARAAAIAAPVTTRRVSAKGTISFAAAQYKAGVWLAGQEVEVVCDRGLVQLHHRGVLIATHARRHALAKQDAGLQRGRRLRPAPKSVTAASVTRKVDSSGNVCFAGTSYRVGAKFRRRQVQVAVVGDTVEISVGEQLIRAHPVRHEHTREYGALANPGCRPHRINAAQPTPHRRPATGVEVSDGYRGLTWSMKGHKQFRSGRGGWPCSPVSTQTPAESGTSSRPCAQALVAEDRRFGSKVSRLASSRPRLAASKTPGGRPSRGWPATRIRARPVCGYDRLPRSW